MADYNTRLYRIWSKMKARCYNKKHNAFDRYGGSGIIVCKDWKNDFQSFKKWAIENGYSDELTIDRIDNNGNYEPNNCRWTTKKEQANNTCRNRLITYKGKTQTLAQWADSIGINKHTLHVRIDVRGWTIERAFEQKPKKINIHASDEERKEQDRIAHHNYYSKNKEIILAKNKERYQQNKEKILEKCKMYRLQHIEESKITEKKWRENNKDYKAKKDKEYREAHVEQIKNYKKEWYSKHKTEYEELDNRLCYDPRNIGSTCTFRALRIFASRHKDSPLVNNCHSPKEWASQFLI